MVLYCLSFHRNISSDSFDLALKGFLTNVGPLDALIEFVEPVTCVEPTCCEHRRTNGDGSVNWQGNDIATILLPPGALRCTYASL